MPFKAFYRAFNSRRRRIPKSAPPAGCPQFAPPSGCVDFFTKIQPIGKSWPDPSPLLFTLPLPSIGQYFVSGRECNQMMNETFSLHTIKVLQT